MAEEITGLMAIPSSSSLSYGQDNLSDAIDRLNNVPQFERVSPGISPRLFTGSMANLAALGINIDQNNQVLKAVHNLVVVNYSLYALYSAYRAVMAAQRTRELALATSETILMAILQQWGRIALALGMGAVVYGSLKAGQAIAQGGSFTFPSFDSSDQVKKRAALRELNRLASGE